MKAIDDYNAALYEIQAATIAEKIIWKRISADTYHYKTMNDDLEDLILTIKKFSVKGSDEYLLSLVKKDFENSEVILNVDTSDSENHLKSSLEELYNSVEYHVDLRSLDGLKNFLKSVKNEKSNGSILD